VPSIQTLWCGYNKGIPPLHPFENFSPIYSFYMFIVLRKTPFIHIRIRSFRGFLDPHHDFALDQLGASSSPLAPCLLLRPFQKFMDPPLTFNIAEFHILSKMEPGIIKPIMDTFGKYHDCFHISKLLFILLYKKEYTLYK
jgi:hypothetical protein